MASSSLPRQGCIPHVKIVAIMVLSLEDIVPMSFFACSASSMTVKLKGGYESLDIRVRVLPHIIAFLWLPHECIDIMRKVLPQSDEEFKQQMRSFIKDARNLARSAPEWCWDRLSGEYSCPSLCSIDLGHAIAYLISLFLDSHCATIGN